jgi:two-component system cell cycle response regulator
VSQARRVLVADDDPTARMLLEDMLLDWGYEVSTACDGEAAWHILAGAAPPPLAILDWMMPGRDGLALCRGLRELPDRPYSYVLLLTSRDDKADVVLGLDAGADDFLTKPVNPQELRSRLAVGNRILDYERTLNEKSRLLADANAELARLAREDGLTRLHNRRFLLEELEAAFARARQGEASLSVMILDVDHFKRVNDTYGHLVGDEVLRAVAKVLRGVQAADHLVGRFGGEEFCVGICGAGLVAACEAAEQIRRSIGELVHTAPGAGPFVVTASIGVAELDPAMPTLEALLGRSDEALYRAKANGRNRVCAAGALPTTTTTPTPPSHLEAAPPRDLGDPTNRRGR